jgi:hypothetical protein
MNRSNALIDPDGSGWEISLGTVPEPVVGLRILEADSDHAALLRLTPNRAAELAGALMRHAQRLGGTEA